MHRNRRKLAVVSSLTERIDLAIDQLKKVADLMTMLATNFDEMTLYVRNDSCIRTKPG